MTKYNENRAIELINNKEYKTVSKIVRELGLSDQSGSNYKSVYKTVKKYNLDTSHWLGQRIHKGKRGKETANYKPIEYFLVLNCGTKISSHNLKIRLFTENFKDKKCECCGIIEWNGFKAPLELDHINGNKNDNRLQNLQILCPNCHAQTPTYKSKNWK